MSLIRIAPLIRFLPKAHPFGSPIYVTVSQHVPFASTTFGIQRAEFPRPASEARIQDARNNFELAKNLPASLLPRVRRASVEAFMGNSKGRDNAKKRARRRKKTERLALAKKTKVGK